MATHKQFPLDGRMKHQMENSAKYFSFQPLVPTPRSGRVRHNWIDEIIQDERTTVEPDKLRKHNYKRPCNQVSVECDEIRKWDSYYVCPERQT